jgi:hypothetical protein
MRAYVLSALAKIDPAYFSEALDAARLTQDEICWEKVLIALAQNDGANFSVLLKEARSIRDESSRVNVLSKLAENVPNALLPKIYQAISEINHKPTRANSS